MKGRAAPVAFSLRTSAVLAFVATGAHAQLPARQLLGAFEEAKSGAARSELSRRLARRDGRLALVVRHARGLAPGSLGLVPITPGLAIFHGSTEAALELAQRPGLFVEWAPPRHLLLDEATATIGARPARAELGASGRGVAIGIIDTGVDASHPDLRNADGTTRIAWFLDFSRPAAAPRSELESEYCCSREECWCSVFDAETIDELVSNSVSGDEPRDSFGHGTHVASLAAGNGSSSGSGEYAGVAPASTLIVARVTRAGGSSIEDADVLLAARFAFERAAALGMPAVVNLSLGNELGAHDGSSLLEQGLASLVGPEEPGRALVVAAGNNGRLVGAEGTGYPGPLGVHTEVHVPSGSSVRVPIILPFPVPEVQDGTVFVWVAAGPEDDLRVGVDDMRGRLLEPVPAGRVGVAQRETVSALVVNGPAEQAETALSARNALVTVDGVWRAGDVMAVRLEGHGTARLWLESAGDAGPSRSGTGALFPRASVQGTVNVPATSPDLIAVGATVNRDAWASRAGGRVETGARVGAPGEFSAAGPSAAGALKPDLSAPGEWVIGAMASLADPDRYGGGLFSGTGLCDGAEHCLVVDDGHAVARGTSMAAPLVSGAVALLMEQDPTLTQPVVRALLQAGSSRALVGSVEQRIGVGVLDVRRSLAVQRGGAPGRAPTSQQSWLVLSDSLGRPGSSTPISGAIVLRDGSGLPADVTEPDRLKLSVSPGSIEQPLRREAPGFYVFRVRVAPGSGGGVLEVRVDFDGVPLLARALPIAVDRAVAGGGLEASGGCSLSGAPCSERWANRWACLALAAGVLLARCRRASSPAPVHRQSDTR